MKVKKLSEYARLPEKAHLGDLGYDLYTNEGSAIFPGETKIVKTGIAIQFPEGYGGIIKDRSSVATKKGLFTVAGVIDNGYIGEICVALYNGTDSLLHVGPGEKIAQLVLIPTVDFEVEEVDEVRPTDLRADAGFGSTGR
jgi:deoxyuridine 5'-triphosphate nucleotidohydrolase